MGFPCDGRKRQHQQGWKELESQGGVGVRAWGACVLTRVCGSIRGARSCCVSRWEFLGCHPPVPPVSLVPSTLSPTPRPVALPAMRCIGHSWRSCPGTRVPGGTAGARERELMRAAEMTGRRGLIWVSFLGSWFRGGRWVHPNPGGPLGPPGPPARRAHPRGSRRCHGAVAREPPPGAAEPPLTGPERWGPIAPALAPSCQPWSHCTSPGSIALALVPLQRPQLHHTSPGPIVLALAPSHGPDPELQLPSHGEQWKRKIWGAQATGTERAQGVQRGAFSLFCVSPWARKIPGVQPGNVESVANNGK